MDVYHIFRHHHLAYIGLILSSLVSTGCSTTASPPPKDDNIKVYGKRVAREDIQGEPVMSIEASEDITVGEFLEIQSAVPAFSSDVSCTQAITQLRQKGLNIKQSKDSTLVAIAPAHQLTVTYNFPNSTCPSSATPHVQ